MTQPQQQRNPVIAAAPAIGLVGHAEALQAILGDLGTVTVAQLVQLFRQHGTGRDFPGLLREAFPEIVRPHAEAAAQITAQWFNDIVPDANAQPVVDLSPERVTKTLDWALHAPTKTPENTESIKSAPTLDETLARLSGSTKRMVLDASRATVITNTTGTTGWARYASANACAFCRLLATRTDLYSSAGIKVDPKTGKHYTTVVGRSGHPRGTQALGEKYHDHCRCIAVPVPAGETYTPPDYVADWQQDYQAARDDGNSSLTDILAHMRANTNAR
jgi:hypothetical protein